MSKQKLIIALFLILFAGLPLTISTLQKQQDVRSSAATATALSPVPSTVPENTTFNVTAFLHGIGNSGDHTNPIGSSFSNKNPQRSERTVSLLVYNSSNQLIATNNIGTITYNSTVGNFNGIIDLGSHIPNGNYIIKIKTDSYLRKAIPGMQNISSSQVNLSTVTLVAGEINGDNVLNILDYNMLMGCYSDLSPPTFCDDTRKILSDLNDDGNVNQLDYNLFIREITVQTGE